MCGLDLGSQRTLVIKAALNSLLPFNQQKDRTEKERIDGRKVCECVETMAGWSATQQLLYCYYISSLKHPAGRSEGQPFLTETFL